MQTWPALTKMLPDDFTNSGLQVGGEKIRLFGLDAPESKQSCNDSKGHPYACGEASSMGLCWEWTVHCLVDPP